MNKDPKWHYDNCEHDWDTEEGYITSMWCEPHLVDVTECLPETEPDQYDNSEDNIRPNEPF